MSRIPSLWHFPFNWIRLFHFERTIEHPGGHFFWGKKIKVAIKTCLFAICLFSSSSASRSLYLRKGLISSEESRPDSSRSALRQRTSPDGLDRGGLWLGTKNYLWVTKTIPLQTCVNTNTHTTAWRIVHLGLAVDPQHWWNVWLSASRALETWCHSDKSPVSSRRNWLLLARGHTAKQDGGQRRGGRDEAEEWHQRSGEKKRRCRI